MVKKNLLRSISVIMACMMAVMTVACGSNNVSTADTANAVETAQEQQIEKSIMAGSQIAASIGEAGKVETVYVTADANGSVNDVIVSEWLKNATASSELSDTTELKDIVNVKGDETFTDNGDGTVTWDAEGSDIYYQGTTDKELPVDMKITYTLDGKEISPADIAGKSGKVIIRFEYDNKAKQTVDVDGKDIEVYTPFAVVSGMMLDSDKFANVEISNGKIISDGGNYIVMGVALPGLKESLDISDDKWDELDDSEEIKDKLSNGFEITADTTDFELGMTVTMASSDILSDFGLSDLTDSGKIDDLKDDMNELNDGSNKLVDGAGELKDGTGKLYDGTKELYDGAGELKDGTDKLYDGTKELKDGTGKLVDGTGKLKDGTGKLKDGTGKLKNGTEKLADGAGQLVDGAGKLADGTSSLKEGTGKLYDGTGSLYDGIVAYTDGVAKANAGAGELAKGAASAKAGSAKISNGIKSAEAGAGDLATGAAKVDGGVQQLVSTMNGMVETLQGSASELQANRQAFADAYSYLTTPGTTCSDTTLGILNQCTNGKITAANVEAVKAAGLAQMAGTQTGDVHQEDNGSELDLDVTGGDLQNPDTESEDGKETTSDSASEAGTETGAESGADANNNTNTDTNTDTNTNTTTIADETVPTASTPAGTQSDENVRSAADSTEENGGSGSNGVSDDGQTSYTKEQVQALIDDAVAKALAKAQEEYENQAKEQKEQAEKEYAEKAQELQKQAEELQKKADEIKNQVQNAQLVTLYMSALSATGTAVNVFDTVLSKMGNVGMTPEQQLAIKTLLDGTNTLSAGANSLQGGLKTLDAGAEALDSGLGDLSNGVASLATGIGTIAASSDKLKSGASQLKSGAGDLNNGAGQLKDGAYQLSSGTKELKSGADELNSGAGELDNGAAELDNGAGELNSGAGELDNGAAELMDGAGQLNDGAVKLYDGAGELNDGAKKLDDGVQELLDGICKFDEEGIKKLYEAFDGDLTEFADKMTAIQEAGSNYTSFGGANAEEKSSVKFIIKTEGVKAQDI